MNRRTFLAGTAATTGVVLSGCAQLTGGLEVTAMDANSTAFGNVEIVAEVRNHGSETQTGTLVGEVDLDDGSTHTERTSVTVTGGQTDEHSVTIDLPISESLSGGRYQYDAWIE